jgi:hypothetical protein
MGMKLRHIRHVATTIIGSSVAACAVAQAPLPGTNIVEPGLRATLGSEFSYDDNLLYQREQKLGTRVLHINPTLDFGWRRQGTDLSVHYDFGHTHYMESPADSFESHSLSYVFNTRLSRIHKLVLEGNLQRGVEARGLGFSEGGNVQQLDAPTPIRSSNLQLAYQLGSDSARLRAVASAGLSDTDRENPLISDDSRDFRANSGGLQLLYRLGWRTDLVAEYRRREVRYYGTPAPAGNLAWVPDSNENQYLVGVDLRATAKTSGRARVGTVERKPVWKVAQWEDMPEANREFVEDPFAQTAELQAGYNDGGRRTYWELAGIWAPRSYSTFTLLSQVTNNEPLFVGRYVRSTDVSLGWTHRWNGWLESEIRWSAGRDQYIGSGREDDRQALNLRLDYSLDSKTHLGIGFRHQQLDSTSGLVGYDKNVYYLYFNYTDTWRN